MAGNSRGGGVDPRSAAPFVSKSASEGTRRAYRRGVSEFFRSAGMKHPAGVVPADVPLRRDRPRSQEEQRRDRRRLQALGRPPLLRAPEGRRGCPARPGLGEAGPAARVAAGGSGRGAGLGGLSPHDLRRAAVTRALGSGLSYRQVQVVSKRRDPKTVMWHGHGREDMGRNAVNFLPYDDE